jgi:hypothetical protein
MGDFLYHHGSDSYCPSCQTLSFGNVYDSRNQSLDSRRVVAHATTITIDIDIDIVNVNVASPAAK